MPTFRVALAMLCLSAASLFAQAPVVTPHEPPPIPDRVPVDLGEEPAERTLSVLQSGRNQQVGAEADVSGANGQLLLETATAPATGLLLRALTATPDIFFKVGTSTSASAVHVQNSAGTSLFRVRGDGGMQLGAYNWGKFTIASFDDNMTAAYLLQSAGIENSSTQNDTGLLVNVLQSPTSSAIANDGGMIAGQVEAYNFGSGTVRWVTGGVFRAGTYTDKTGTVINAYGVQTQVRMGAGTVTNGYGLYIHDTEAVNDYGIYQVGTNDSNYFAANTGIGTTNPQQKLHVVGNAIVETTNPASYSTILFNPGDFSGTHGGSLSAMGANYTAQPNTAHSAGTLALTSLETGGVSLTSGNATNGSIRLYTAGSGPANERMRILHAGNVIIGPPATVAPENAAKLLNVQGDANFAGTVTGTNIRAHYQDVAEWVPSTTDLTPGTVVILNRERNNEVMASATAYDTTVAGVVSAQPGLSLGIEGEGKEQIATTGRVKVRVDARRLPIQIGDLLVTSDVPGTAMRSEPMAINGRSFHQPGTIIGKALEPLAGGVGEILVLLSMQ
jgi:hypothetical protein